jgi:hypothetical protein
MASIKDLKRMCESYGDYCTSCPLHELKKLCAPNTIADNADEIVDKWVSEHPTKTYAMDFFEKFPDAQRRTTGIPIPCIRAIYSKIQDEKCSAKCPKCWNREMKEDD